ncbi:CaiB/BaiF CoA transferase family protein [Sphingomonas japonica]|uniref:Alpha-methylacyl-CoA racemase n=1 Tax=Sphingomonas japonica TaxID=511662 RepID=A0ABX0TYF7_9SPHN|nr:CaiB/BaiF CoA-transferase family protein [Sphingomonas japonica]NIJ23348.1 alpha-methylacyl-CoA racemase [Sphingomonas japonica]
MTGALAGIRIVEFTGIGPGPFAGMMLADHGAQVIRIVRPTTARLPALDRFDVLARSRSVIAIDMKTPAGIAVVRDLCRCAHGVIEGYRPGVMERLGLGPDILIGDTPALVYGRITGWGQDGPLAQAAGHDINYIAINGVLHTIGRKGERPAVPVNYVGDFGGGGMLLAFGMLAALLAVRNGAPGQVVDAAMVDGSALLSGMVWQMKAAGLWRDLPQSNWLDGGAHFYDSYACADGKFVAIGAIEAPFYALLRERLGLADDPAFDAQFDPAAWDGLRDRLAAVFATRTRDEWAALLEGSDACFAPVLSLGEALAHPHIAARGTFVEVAGHTQPAPAPRFSKTPAATPSGARPAGEDVRTVLAGIGYDGDRVEALIAARIVG